MDAALIAAAQAVEHYELTRYGLADRVGEAARPQRRRRRPAAHVMPLRHLLITRIAAPACAIPRLGSGAGNRLHTAMLSPAAVTSAFRYCHMASRDRKDIGSSTLIAAPPMSVSSMSASSMPASSMKASSMSAMSTRRPALLVAAIVGGVMTAMIVEIVLARRGLMLTGGARGGGTQMHAALAWWAITGAAFVASFAIAATMSRVSWLYFRSLRWVAAAALVLVLATIGDAIPLVAADAAGHYALAILTALTVAMLMAGFGAFFAVRQ
jgi:hypothetical protein